MINVDEVAASRLIFAPMGVFFGKCCGNAASKIACGRSPNRANSRHSAKVGEDPVFIAREHQTSAPPYPVMAPMRRLAMSALSPLLKH